MEIGKIERMLEVQPEPFRVTPIAPVEPSPQPEPELEPVAP